MLPPADGFVDADSHEDDGEQQGAEDAAQQHQVLFLQHSVGPAALRRGQSGQHGQRPAPQRHPGSARFGSTLQHGDKRRFLFLPPAPPRAAAEVPTVLSSPSVIIIRKKMMAKKVDPTMLAMASGPAR